MTIETYIFVFCIVVMLPLAIGYTQNRLRIRKLAEQAADGGTGAIDAHPQSSVLFGILVWISAAWLARRYADTDMPGWQFAEWFAHRGKWFVFSFPALLWLGRLSPLGRSPTDNRRASFLIPAIAIVVFVVVWRTIPVYVFISPSPERDDRGHIRQSIEITCGPVALANLLELQSITANVNEREIARLSSTTFEGTTTDDLIRAAGRCGLDVVACRRLSMSEIESFRLPAIVSVSTIPSVRHAALFLCAEVDAVVLLDPGYGLIGMTRNRFEEIRYGKTLILKRRSDATPSR